jgi:hypothetical protein
MEHATFNFSKCDTFDLLDPPADGTSNTVLFAERHLRPDGEHVLTAVQHGSQTYGPGNVQKGGWISDVTYERSSGGTAVAMETLTIAHEGIELS